MTNALSVFDLTVRNLFTRSQCYSKFENFDNAKIPYTLLYFSFDTFGDTYVCDLLILPTFIFEKFDKILTKILKTTCRSSCLRNSCCIDSTFD